MGFNPAEPRDREGKWIEFDFKHEVEHVPPGATPGASIRVKHQGRHVGSIRWWADGKIAWVESKIPGLGGELIRRAKELEPRLHHDSNLTKAGKKFAARYPLDLATHYDPAEPRDAKGRWTKAETTAWLAKHPIDPKNIVDAWDQATPGERHAGEVWYPNAHRLAQALGKRYGVSAEEAAGLLAAYSPQTPWGKNVITAAEALREEHGIGGPGAHIWYHHDPKTPNTVEEREGVMAPGLIRDRADRIMAGANPDEVFAGGRLKSGRLKPNGLKIRAFADLIANGVNDPANPRVVIDRHAAGVARGVRFTDDDYGFDGPSSSMKKFSAYAEAYKEAAAQISKREGRTIPPEAVQAATWLVRQRLNGAMQTQVGRTRSNLGKQDAQRLRDYIDQYLPTAETFVPKVGYSDLTRHHARPPIDLARPAPAKPQQKVQAQPQQPPQNTTSAVLAIGAVLLAGGAAAFVAARVHGLLARWKIDREVVDEVLKITEGGTAHIPGLDGALHGHTVKVARHDVFFRAAYIANAAWRVQQRVRSGESLAQALGDESRFFAMHEKARKGRLRAAEQVATAAEFFGIPEHDGTLVGWYLNPLLNNEAECIAANGHNFYAEHGTVIGLPGSVHNGCGCYAGPPWTGAAMVDDVFRNTRVLLPVLSRAKFRLKEKKGA